MLKQILLVIVFFAVGFIGVLGVSYSLITHNPPKTSPITTKFSFEKAPSQALVGNIVFLSGDTGWISRTATTSSTIKSPIKLQQGEGVTTGTDGKLQFIFPSAVSVSLMANSQVNIIQTLPVNIMLQEVQGTASYTRINLPVSIRALDMVMTLEKAATVQVQVDPKTSRVFATVTNGTITVAYTDTNNTSNLISVKSGEKLVFNNNTKEEVIR